MATIYEMDMANLFAEDEDPSKSQYLTLEEVKIPALVEKTTEHSGGGAMMGLKIGLGMFEAPELTFKLRGFNPDVMNKIMGPGRGRRKYSIMGNVRDLEAALDIPARIVIEGRLTKVDMGSFQRDSSISTEYQVDEVWHYEFHLGNVEKYYLNYGDGPSGVRVDGIAVYASAARNLGLA